MVNLFSFASILRKSAILHSQPSTTIQIKSMSSTAALHKLIVMVIGLSSIALLSGCQITPVAAWEKGDLAEATMSPTGLAQYKAVNTHVYTSKETARGGDGVAGGGCGCN